MAIRQVLARDVRAAASSSKTLASLRHISHFTAIGGRSGSKAAAYEAKRAAQAYKRAADRSTVAPDGRVQPLRTRTPAVGTDGKPLLFVGASKSILGRRQDADDKSKSESLSKPLSLSGLYPSVKLPKIEDEPLPRIVKPRVPGTPMKKKPRVLGHIERTRIDADEFAARLPYHRSTLYTIAVRAGLTDPALPQLAGRPRAYEGEEHATEVGQVEEADDLERAILQVLTHPSFFESSAALRSNVEPILSTEPLAPAKAPVVSSKEQERRDNSLLAATGRSIIDLVLTEYLVKRFPNLPTKSLGYALTALTNQGALVDVGRELAIGSLHTSRDHGQDDMQATGTVVRYRKLPYGVEPTEEKPELKYLAIGEAVRALVGLVYERQGLPAATALVKRHFASRSLDFDGLVKLLDPLRALRETVVRFGLERPVARLLVESGRLSATPTYVIGVFSGDIKLGEGSGSKILEAQRAAATAGLKALWFEEADKIVLSVQTFPDHPLLDRPNWALERLYQTVAPPIGESEAITHSATKEEKPKAIGGYLHEPLYNRKQLEREHFHQTHVLPRTADSLRPGSSAARRLKGGFAEPDPATHDVLAEREKKSELIKANPAARRVNRPTAKGVHAKARLAENDAAFRAGVGAANTSSSSRPPLSP